MSRFKAGDKVRLWKPRHAEHGCYGVVTEVIPIEQYYEGQPYNFHRGPHAYRCVNGWKWDQPMWKDGKTTIEDWGAVSGFLPDAMVVSEEDFQKSEQK